MIVADAVVEKGAVRLPKIPLEDHTRVRVVVIPKADLQKMSFARVRALTSSIPGGLSQDVADERAQG